MHEPDLTAELDAAEEIVMGRAEPEPRSEHVAVSRMMLFGGASHEAIHVDRAFLVGAIRDTLAWCHEMEGPGMSGPTSGKVADYDAALAVLQADGEPVPVCPKCKTAGCLEDKAADW